MTEILVPISLFASIVLIMFLFYTTRNKERLALIEKGADANLFKSKSRGFPTLKIGMFLVGIGLGVLFGNIIANYTSLIEQTAYFSMIFLFAGLALVVNYLIEGKKLADENN
ncbi:MAG: hypothetical protein JXR51_16070 [Bacteroidales bacterium]|nr:hypothetical protein [Bacteroidales bacterium]MBN2758684.1 hypothetical protein [Bacteroidales bacterium]